MLTGIRVIPNPDLLDIVYPVAGSGAAGQLSHIEKGRRHEVIARITHEYRLGAFGKNAPECLLCETETKRATRIKDYLLKNSYLFYMSESGTSLVKPYGSALWGPV